MQIVFLNFNYFKGKNDRANIMKQNAFCKKENMESKFLILFVYTYVVNMHI